MSETCPKCGANRTQFEGQTSWECGSYSMYVPGLNPFLAHAESEHCRCRQRAEQAEAEKRKIRLLLDETEEVKNDFRTKLAAATAENERLREGLQAILHDPEFPPCQCLTARKMGQAIDALISPPQQEPSDA